MSLSEDSIFETAVAIILEEKRLVVVVGENKLSIKFPTTRRLAERFGVPNYYILPYFSVMEDKKLIVRIEREGIFTTNEGSRKLLTIMKEKDTENSLLDDALINVLIKRSF